MKDFSNQQAQAQPDLLPAPTVCTTTVLQSGHTVPSSASPDAFRPGRTDLSPPSPAAIEAALKGSNFPIILFLSFLLLEKASEGRLLSFLERFFL